MWQTLRMLTQAPHIIREEVPSLERTILITKISDMVHKTKIKHPKDQAGRHKLSILTWLVSFLVNFWQALINQNSLMGDVFTKAVEWA